MKKDVVGHVGGYDKVPLSMLNRLYRAGDGDCGICFEYAVHDAVERNDPMVMERLTDVLTRHCKIPGTLTRSVLFAVEKQGNLQLIETANQLLTDDSVLLYGTKGNPVKLKRHLRTVAEAFNRATARAQLPQSISGLWKADLFLGRSDSDKWVGTTVKINKSQLEGAKGLRVGIVPAKQGQSDLPHFDDGRNLIVCPLLYDGSFMETFYTGWGVVKQFMAADCDMPKEVDLVHGAERYVAKLLADRRAYPIVDVVGSLANLAQPELLETTERDNEAKAAVVGAVVAPIPRATNADF
ncbi:hypothetical protein BH11MYX4_BH11MYX4_01850 [soil metagenome]